MKFFTLLISAVLLFISCGSDKTKLIKPTDSKSNIEIVTTTGMLKDLTENLAPDNFKVTALMGPGVDPHYYKASQGDLVKLQKANLIIYNGLHLEGKMGEVFRHLSKRKEIWEAGSALSESDKRVTGEFASGVDPHFWFDVNIWIKVGKALSIKLQKQFPTYKKQIQLNEKAYLQELETLNKEIVNELSTLSKDKRILFTAHDAFGYFGRAYNIEVKALQGLSTTTEFGLKDVQNTVETIINSKIKAIFIESSVSPKAIHAVVEQCASKNYTVSIGGELYSDAMGDYNTPEGTYIGMLKHNLNTFVKAVK